MKKTITIICAILISSLGIAQSKYDNIEGFSAGINGFEDGLAVVLKNGKRGLINKNGTEILPCNYDFSNGFKCGLLKVEKNEKWGYVNKKGEEVIPLIYDGLYDCSDFFNNIAVVNLNGKYGCINTKGQLIVPPIYDKLDEYSEEGLIEYELDGKFGMIDTLGNKIVPNKYERIGRGWDTFIEGFAVVTKNGKKGYINTKGQEAIKCIYENACDFSEGLAAVQLDGKWGFVNTKGELIINNKFDGVSASSYWMDDLYFTKGIARVVLNGIPIFIDKFGNKLKKCPYIRLEKFIDGFAAVCIGNSFEDGKWGFINEQMELVVPCIYSFFQNNGLRNSGWSHYFENSIAIVTTDNGKSDPFGDGYLYSFIDTTGKQLMSWKPEWPGPNFQEGLGAIEKNGKWGFINKSGEMAIPFIYEDIVRYYEQQTVAGFSEGLIAVKKNGKWGFINTSGINVIPFIYDQAFNFSEGLALVKKDNNYIFVNKYGVCELLCR